ncbi:MAG: hypothetical protein U5L09_22830 [Bacteroidales bacterium]|nr:hypothetical protein [Bacteroidales bacterium]
MNGNTLPYYFFDFFSLWQPVAVLRSPAKGGRRPRSPGRPVQTFLSVSWRHRIWRPYVPEMSGARMFKPARMAVNVEAGIDFSRQAEWTYSEDLWTGRLAISDRRGQSADPLRTDRFLLPPGQALCV